GDHPVNDDDDHRRYLSTQTPTSPRKGQPTMATSPHHIGTSTYLDELLTQVSPDLMRQMCP
ncbi:hypothetical protein V6758_15145, partial [Corynebacterium kalidii]